MKKTLFAILFAVIVSAIFLSSCNSNDNGAVQIDYSNFSFIEVDDGYEMRSSIKLFSGNFEGELRVPDFHNNLPVVELDSMSAMFGRGITKIVGSRELLRIESWTFAGNDQRSMDNLTEVIFPVDGKLKRIDTGAFYWQTSLCTVILPKNIEYLGDGVFERCFALENLVIYNSNPPEMNGDIFNWNGTLANDEYWHTRPNADFIVYVPDESVGIYQNSNWGKYNIHPISLAEEIVETPQGTDALGTYGTNDLMSSENKANDIIAIVIGGTILAAFVIVIVVLVACNYKKRKIVYQNSGRIKRLLELNATIRFKKADSTYNINHACTSKRQLDNLSLDDYIITKITEYDDYYAEIVGAVLFNRKKYASYLNELKSIQSTATEDFCKSLGFTLESFHEYENSLFNKNRLNKPRLDFTVHCKATYTSPQGRNHYWKEDKYTFDEFKDLYDEALRIKEQRKTRQYQIKAERSRMTDSLRYDILKRDNFRCQICGATAQDGAKLHVDHIVPVSKGGLTTVSNLRTLCDRCNLGKSDKL